MRSQANKSFTHGFTIDEQELRRLHDLMSNQLENVTDTCGFTTTYEVGFQNGVIANPQSLDEIIAQENLGSASIQRLRIDMQGKSSHDGYKLQVEFLDPNKEGERGDVSIRYRIEGDDRDWVFVTSSQVEERIARVKTFAFVANVSSRRSLPTIFFLIAGTFIFSSMNQYEHIRLQRLAEIESVWGEDTLKDVGELILAVERLPKSLPMNSWVFVVMFVLPALLVSAEWWFKPVLTFLYPPYNFLWGDYIKQYESRKSTRNFWLVIVAGGVVLSVLGNFIYTLLSQAN